VLLLLLIFRRRTARGAGAPSVSIDAHGAEDRYRFEPADTLTADRLLNRAWAITLLDQFLDLLAAEYAAKGRSRNAPRREGYSRRLRRVIKSTFGSRCIAKIRGMRRPSYVMTRKDAPASCSEGCESHVLGRLDTVNRNSPAAGVGSVAALSHDSREIRGDDRLRRIQQA
jgi:hypothetical protein